MLLALDTETTGLDARHGCLPFFVSTCDDSGVTRCWEWDVDPTTRRLVERTARYDLGQDIEDILALVARADELVLHNMKFDVAALTALDSRFASDWPWDKAHDTLRLGHLLASNKPHDLTTMAQTYLGVRIDYHEDALAAAVQAARRLVKTKAFVEPHGRWRLSESGDEMMPSVKESGGQPWRGDYWLPRAVAAFLGYEPSHEWHTVLATYATVDAEATCAMLPVLLEEVARRRLGKVYEFFRAVPRLQFGMEERGVTVCKTEIDALREEYKEESARLENVCVNIAASREYGSACEAGAGRPCKPSCALCGGRSWVPYNLELGKGVNKSLREFVFDRMGLEHVRNPKARTDAPALDSKNAIPHYLATLAPNSKEHLFIKSLAAKRTRDTAVGFMDSYERFWRPWVPAWPGAVDAATGAGWYVLHPSLNATGTSTLRWSSSNPNEQNISKKEGFNLRRGFGPAPGREWWSLDAENIELRLPTYECKEPEMMALFERPHDPPYYGSNHLLVCHILHPELFEKCLKDGVSFKDRYKATWYQWVKNGNFAILYGAVDKADGTGTADRAFHVPGAHARIKSRFKNLEALNQKWIYFATRHGYVETIPDRTVDPERGYPLLCSRTENGRILETVPLNYHTQGSAMWWTTKAMVRCQDRLDEWNREARRADYHMTMQVHDECVFDFPRAAHPLKDPSRSNLARIREIRDLMMKGGDDFGIPTPVGVEYHDKNWAEGVKVKF